MTEQSGKKKKRRQRGKHPRILRARDCEKKRHLLRKNFTCRSFNMWGTIAEMRNGKGKKHHGAGNEDSRLKTGTRVIAVRGEEGERGGGGGGGWLGGGGGGGGGVGGKLGGGGCGG